MAKGTHSYDLDKSNAYKIISLGAKNLPAWLTDFGNGIVSGWMYNREQSKAVVDGQVKNLDIILGDSITRQQKFAMVKKIWRMQGRFLMEMFRFEEMSNERLQSRISEFKGLDNIHKALEKGKGAIILTAHLGHWGLGGMLLSYLGFKINIVQLQYESTEQNELLDRGKELRGINVIHAADPVGFAINVFNALKRNELVAIQGDRDIDGTGLMVEFFGKPARFPKGPVILAMKTGAPLVPAFTIMGDKNIYHPVAEAEIPMQDTGNFDDDLLVNVQRSARVIEKYVRAHPEQWFNFYYFWE